MDGTMYFHKTSVPPTVESFEQKGCPSPAGWKITIKGARGGNLEIFVFNQPVSEDLDG